MNVKKAWRALWASEAQGESSVHMMYNNRMRSLNKHIEILQTVCDDQGQLIANLSKQANLNRSANMEEKVIQTLLDAFMPRHKSTPSADAATPAEGILLSDEELNNRIKLIPSGLIPKIQVLPDDLLAGKIKELYPEMARESISKAIQRIKAL